jgi:hypothetical protein
VNKTIELTFDERRAAYLRLQGKGLADIARDLKLDSCFIGKRAAQLEAKAILESAADKLDEDDLEMDSII